MLAIVLLLPLLQATQDVPDSSLVRAREAIKPLVDSVALRDAGFFAIGFGAGVRDLTPFQGQHWLSLGRFANNQPVTLTRPTFMMYLPRNDSLIPIGVAYSRRIPIDSAQPVDLAGQPAEWHSHVICRAVPGEGQVIADGVEDCKSRGGTPPPNQITMVHVWTVPNPDGLYAHDNPALPYIATGLTPPAHAGPDERLFAVALGETYGARLFVALRIDRDAAKAGTRSRLEAKRAAMRALIAPLREAERANDRAKFGALRKQLVDGWSELANEYRAIAESDALRTRFDVELNQMLGAAHHHGG